MTQMIGRIKWRGIPIFFHWTVVLMIVWFWLSYQNILYSVVAACAYTLLILVHELGHALVAQWRNVKVESIQVFILHGLCFYQQPDEEKDEIWIAWGGVLAQACLLIIALLAVLIFKNLPTMIQYNYAWLANVLFYVFVYMNIFTIIFNLLPIGTLDGVKAWRVLHYYKLAKTIGKKAHRPTELEQVKERAKRHKALHQSSQKATEDILRKIQGKD